MSLSLPKLYPCSKNSRSDLGNYRPVSILCIFSKILEKVVYTQLESYLVKGNLLYEFQSGFRPLYSTDSCLIHLSDFIRLNMDKGLYTGMVLLDLQKAFDTVNHQILCQKLSSIGLDPLSITWFHSYLSDRSQEVHYNGASSSPNSVTCGVPQGSLLGPFLFLIYVNDMAMAVNCKLLLYADDSALLVSGKDINEIEQSLSTELNSVSQWLCDNKLSLHLGKTESIIFGSSRNLKKVPSFNITCNGQPISSTSAVKYLGMELDQSVSGELQAESAINKINSKLKFLYRQGQGLSTGTRKLLCSALLQPHFDYACAVWYSSVSCKLKHKLQVCQNKIIRFIDKLGPRSHVGATEIVQKGWLNVENRVKQLKLSHMFKILSGACPDYMKENVVRTSARHRYATRSSAGSLVVPRVGGPGSRTFIVTATKLWNELPHNIQDSESLPIFKSNVKKFLLHTMIEEEQSNFIYY